jgi:adenylate cyclase
MPVRFHYRFFSDVLQRWYWALAIAIVVAVWLGLVLAMRPVRDADGSFASHPYGLTTQSENHALDLLFQLRDLRGPERSRRGFNEPITIIDIDERAIKAARLRPSKWRRDWYARLIDRANDGGARVIGLDLLLSEEGGPTTEDAARDQVLAESIARAGKVVIARKSAAGGYEAINPLPLFAQAAWAVGFVDVPIDGDGFVRSSPVFLKSGTGEDEMVSFASHLVEGYRAAEAFDNKFAELTGRGVGEETAQREAETYARQNSRLKPAGGDSFLCGDLKLWLRTDRFLQLDFRARPPAFQRISAAEILFDDEAQIPNHLFQNRIVIIGESFLAGSDLYQTPFYEPAALTRLLKRSPDAAPIRTPGVELHATAAATMLFGKALARPAYGRQAAALLLPLLLTGLAIFWLRPLWALLSVIIIAVASLLAASWAFETWGLILPLADVWLGLAVLTPLGLGSHYARERVRRRKSESERKQVMDIFSRFVSEDVAARMWERRGQDAFAGEARTVTVIFTDIRGFTTLSESVSSKTVVDWLNDYFGRMYEVIRAHGGHINKFMGDGLMIVFGAPIDRGDREEAQAAVACGLAMLAAVDRMNLDWKIFGRPEIRIGVGINTGEATCGVVGAQERLEYTLIGDTVNLASRLESATKELGAPIVISATTARLLGDNYEIRSLGEIRVKGKTLSTSVYTVEIKQSVGSQAAATELSEHRGRTAKSIRVVSQGSAAR